jgi:hypothetical protein
MDKEERQQATLHRHGKETKHRRILQQLFHKYLQLQMFVTCTFYIVVTFNQ